MIESAFADREVAGTTDRLLSGADLGRLARSGASVLRGKHSALVYVGENHPQLPVALFASALAEVPFVPINYRLDDEQLLALVSGQAGCLCLVDESTAPRLAASDAPVEVFDDWLGSLPDVAPTPEVQANVDDVAIILFTSGTTSAPKAAVLRHRHLMAYLLGAVEFASADPNDAVLISVPPYHIAGMTNLLSNLFAGRRLVYLDSFDATDWLRVVRREAITNAMVVPTMLAQIVEAVDGARADTPSLRSLSYGGAPLSERVLLRALEAFPDTGFVNGYGLTETASSVAVLTPSDHRAALTTDDPVVRGRLSSVGQVLPTVDLQIRDDADETLPAGETGMIHVRGEQISGEYSTGSVLDDEGWFCTGDRGFVDDEGYLFIEGRADDTIIRGGENIAPAEIEEALQSHDDVALACAVGVPDEEWGQRVVAAVVRREGGTATEDELRAVVRGRLRGAKTPDSILFVEQIPFTETGKMLRRVVAEQMSRDFSG